HPLLYCISLDILPTQASTVPCKHVFSSGKEINTDHHNNLLPEMMQMLQMIKYMFHKDRLSFENDWLNYEHKIAEIPSHTSAI
ncbi:hypothetical protein PAXRUDRAFT_148157, partial [Paxillus rubicundulus Ve08.2h10]